ncbi:MAG TPA: ROK family transcriptional regulator [Leptolinea sp.]
MTEISQVLDYPHLSSLKTEISSTAAVRAHNLSTTLNLIRDRGSITRAEIIQITKLSAPTISSLVNILIDSDFVREGGIGLSSGGRKPVVLEFNYDVRKILGIDMGATHITIVLMNLKGEVSQRFSYHLDVLTKPQEALQTINNAVKNILNKAGLTGRDLLGIGYTVPAPLVNDRTGEFITHYMPAWKNIHCITTIHEVTSDVPVYFENDANAAAIAEKWWGCGLGYDNLVYIKLGTGVGSGLVINGDIYKGFNGTAGEIGHTTIEADGRKCRCGNRGCLESYIGIQGILSDGRNALKDNPKWKDRLADLDVKGVVLAAREGNQECEKIITTAGWYLGIGLANIINLVNPGLLILGGDLADAGQMLLEPARKSLVERTVGFNTRTENLVIGEMGSNAVAIGAATLVIMNAFHETNIYSSLRNKEQNAVTTL